jgi:hypothetical protein
MSMMQKLGVPLVLVLLAGASVALADDVPPIHKATPAGQAVKLRNHVKLTSTCAGSEPTISFSQKPAHGTVDVRPDRFTFGEGYVSGALKACEGRQVDGIAIWYTPAAGFHGVDQISWTADFGGSKNRRVDNYSAQVTVQ